MPTHKDKTVDNIHKDDLQSEYVDNNNNNNNHNNQTNAKGNVRYKSRLITQFFSVTKESGASSESSTHLPSSSTDVSDYFTTPSATSPDGEQEIQKVEIYTDGSCLENGKKNAKSAYAYVIYVNDVLYHQETKVIQESKNTNQRAELYAILESFHYVKQHIPHIVLNPNNFFTVYSDSEYSIKCITEWCKNWDADDWAKKKNTDILRKLLQVYREFNVTFKHVRAHTSATDKHSLRNAHVDGLARGSLQN
jgi:ribonuclease HI